jgi:hypothetical protein
MTRSTRDSPSILTSAKTTMRADTSQPDLHPSLVDRIAGGKRSAPRSSPAPMHLARSDRRSRSQRPAQMSPGRRPQLSGFDRAQVCAMRTADWYQDRDVSSDPRPIRIAPPPPRSTVMTSADASLLEVRLSLLLGFCSAEQASQGARHRPSRAVTLMLPTPVFIYEL